MSLAGLTVLLISLVGVDDVAQTGPVQISMVAVQATSEGRSQKYFSPGLKPEIRRSVSGLNYDTFSKLQEGSIPVPFNEEAKFYINEKYTLYITPLTVTGDDRVRMKARITVVSREKGKTVNALDTTLTMARNSRLNLGGLRLDDGELIVVISVR